MVASQMEFYPNFLFSNPHLQTIIPHQFRKVPKIDYNRERVELLDGDFIDLDWSINQNTKLCILLHGLESNSNRTYIYGMVHALKTQNYDVVVMNLRGCSGESNRLFSAYHSGKTDDLNEIMNHINNVSKYQEVNLIGFSLGANIVLKYLGEYKNKFPIPLHKAVAISCPCDLSSSSRRLEHWSNKIYHDRFLHSLKNKLLLKKAFYPDLIHETKIRELETLREFDEYYTAPVHGFESAKNYYEKASSKQYISEIEIPTLLITAQDDPFLSFECMPYKEVKNNKQIFFLNPRKGGHVGFLQNIQQQIYWHEQKTIDFITEIDISLFVK